jgi:transcriptional regulator with XRE-family HTH domain
VRGSCREIADDLLPHMREAGFVVDCRADGAAVLADLAREAANGHPVPFPELSANPQRKVLLLRHRVCLRRQHLLTKVSTQSTPNMGKVSTHAELSRALRKALGGITQAELAVKLLVSRNYISQIEADLKTPSPRLVAQMQHMLTASAPPVSTAAQHAFAADEEDEFGPDQRRHLKSGGNRGGGVEEPRATYETVASRIPQQRTPSTRQDCEDYLRQLLDRAEASEDPNAWPVILHRLRKQFPLAEWDEPPPAEDKR